MVNVRERTIPWALPSTRVVLVAIATVGAMACIDKPLPTQSAASQVARLAVSMNLRSVSANSAPRAVVVRALYRRTTGAAVLLAEDSAAVTGAATQQVPLKVDLTPCLTDRTREGTSGTCPLRLSVILRDAAPGRNIDSVSIGPFSSAGGDSITVPSVNVCEASVRTAVGEIRQLTASEAPGFCVGDGTGGQFALIAFNASLTAGAATVQVTGTNTTTPSVSFSRSPLDDARMFPPGLDGERELRERERRDLTPLLARNTAVPYRAAAPQIPPTASLGSLVTLNVNLRSANPCSDPPVLHTTRVAAMSQRTIVLIDTIVPPGGYTTAELQAFADAFDPMLAVVESYFGAMTDIDGNGRVALVFTSGLNDGATADPSLASSALTHSRDLFPRVQTPPLGSCSGSNEGEIIYFALPDPNATINPSFRTKWTPTTHAMYTAHQLQHLINAARRLYVNGTRALEETWLMEGLCQVTEELVYYAAAGLTPRSNLSSSEVRATTVKAALFDGGMRSTYQGVAAYFAAPNANAPLRANLFNEQRGASWQLLRYSADHRAGAEREAWFALGNATTTGATNYTAVFGNQLDQLRNMVIGQFVDDLLPSVSAQYANPSWNHRSVMPTVPGIMRFPLATLPVSNGTPTAVDIIGGGVAYLRFDLANNSTGRIAVAGNGQPLPSTMELYLVRVK